MESKELEGGFKVWRLNAEDLKNLPKVNLRATGALSDDIIARIRQSVAEISAREEAGVIESPEPVAQPG